MTSFLLIIFAAVCAGLLAWGMREKGRIYEFPFLAGATFTGFVLPQLIGTKKTYELILTGEALSAEEALNFGFVNKVVPEADLQKHVDALIARIGEFSGPVLEVTKRVISSSIGRPLKEAMKTSQDLYLNELMNLEDVQEGLRAVIEKRKPVWKNK